MNKITTTTTTVTNSNHLSSIALRQFFGWIESRYGGNIPMEQHVKVITVPDHHHQQQQQRILHSEDLVRLMQHDPGVIAIHVKEFYPKAMAIQIGKQLTLEAEMNNSNNNTVQNWNISTNRGFESSDVTTIGAYSPYNIVVASSRSNNTGNSSHNNNNKDLFAQKEDEYFIGVQNEHYQRRRRRMKSLDGNDEPFLWPLDLLRLQLDEAWPSGAGLARRYSSNTTIHRPLLPAIRRPILPIQNPPYGGGLPRIMYGPTRYTKGFVHVDEMGPLHPQNGLFSANIYLQLPDQIDHTKDENSDKNNNNNSNSNDANIPQEVLEIWPTRIMKRWDWYRNMLLLSGLSSTNLQDQIRLRHELGSLPVRIAVTPGDLILFCVQRPHAAIGFQYGTRVSLQCFIQHHGIHQRLLIDS